MDPKADIPPLAVGGVGEEGSEWHERIGANMEKEAQALFCAGDWEVGRDWGEEGG